jgi:predicted PurR-regulated permease PerM
VEGVKVSRYVFIAVLLVLLYLAFRLAQPFFTYIFMAIILIITVYPVYNWLCKKVKSKKLSSIITIILVLLIIIIPSFIVVSVLVKQTGNFIGSFNLEHFDKINNYLIQVIGPKADLRNNFSEIVVNIKDFVLKSAVSIAGSVADIVLGLFIMFFIMYFGFVEGNSWSSGIKQVIPMSKDRKEKLIRGVKDVTHAVIYGQILIALLEGILGGIGFLIVGIHNPVFWGFIMTVLAFIPLVGSGLIWVPAGIIEIINNNMLGGIFILVYCFFIFTVIDNLLKPRIISGKGKIHPIVGLIGVLGGLKLFGFLGIIIGPIIAALFITMAEFFYEDYVKER